MGRTVSSSGKQLTRPRLNCSAKDIASDDKCKRPVWNVKNGKQIELSYPGKPDMCELGLGDSFGSYVCQNSPGLSRHK